jgi:hypothetical protein
LNHAGAASTQNQNDSLLHRDAWGTFSPFGLDEVVHGKPQFHHGMSRLSKPAIDKKKGMPQKRS